MCGRYARRATKQMIAEHFRIESESLPEFGPSYNIAPQTFQPVVRLNRDTGEREIVLMRWGLVPFWAKDPKVGFANINAKAETVATAPAFREAFRRRRCLVPADAFYEWQRLDARTKQPFAIALRSGAPYAFAGLWERWRDPRTREPLETFTLITTDPNEAVSPLHDRMPVIVPEGAYDRWLEAGNADPEQPPLDLLRPYPAEKMRVWRVDKAVGNVRNDTPALLDPAPSEAGTAKSAEPGAAPSTVGSALPLFPQ